MDKFKYPVTNTDRYQLLIFDVSINFCHTFCFSGRPVGENGIANQEVKKKWIKIVVPL